MCGWQCIAINLCRGYVQLIVDCMVAMVRSIVGERLLHVGHGLWHRFIYIQCKLQNHILLLFTAMPVAVQDRYFVYSD